MTDNDDLKSAPDTVVIQPLQEKVDFSMTIPGSKSIANRALLAAAMADGASLVAGIPDSDDSQAAMSVLDSLGIRAEKLDREMYRVYGCCHEIPKISGDLAIRSAGTVGRFLPGLLASHDVGDWRLVSTPQLARRPIGPLVDGLRTWGADIACEEDGKSFPLRVKGTTLKGGEVSVSARQSSQFASGLLMAAPFCRETAVVRIDDIDPQESYIDITLGIMRFFGAEIACASNEEGTRLSVEVAPGPYRAADLRVEADLNSALNFLILPLIVGGRATVTNVSGETHQSGNQLLNIFPRLRGIVRIGCQEVSVASSGEQPKGGFDVDMRAMSEMALSMGVLAVFADEPITMTNLAHIRHHETDRLAAITEILNAAGVTTEQGDDWVRVFPTPREQLKNVTIDSRDDHRVVMALALLGLAGNGLTITNAAAVAKTFPDFFARLKEIGADVRAG